LCAEAFLTDPKLTESIQMPHRYNAACVAVLAAVGQGQDAGQLDAMEKARLRKQAVDWLRADLALWARYRQNGKSEDRRQVARKMAEWQRDDDLAGIRDQDALAKLPAPERELCQKLWLEVEALRQPVKQGQ